MGRYRSIETEKSEQRFEARIWWALAGIAVVVLVITAFQHFQNYRLVHSGTRVEAEYIIYEKTGREAARYTDPNTQQIIVYDLESMDAVHEGDTIYLYYTDNINAARPQQKASIFLFAYLLFGAMLLFSSWRIARIYSKKGDSIAYEPLDY